MFCFSAVALCLPLLASGASALEELLVTKPDAFRPITVADGRPQFVIPPESRLARNEHPRFLLVKEDLETLRRRLADPRVATEFEALKRQCDPAKPWASEFGGCKHALLWKLTGDRKYLDAIRNSPEFRRPTWVFGWPATMDLLWEDLTPDERKELSDLVAQSVVRDGSLYWRPTLHLVSVFYEGGTGPNDAAFLVRMKRDFDQTLVGWTDKLNKWAAGRGGSDMGHGYNGEHAYWEPFAAAICWAHATGEDYLGRADFARYQSPFYWYHLVPKLEPLCVEKIGVTRCADDAGAVSEGHSGANHLLFLTFTRENDGLGLAWMDKFRTQEPPWNRDREALGRVLWWDPDQQPLDPTTLPLTRLFPTSGHVVMRSDWTEDATFATFRCGRFGEIDGTWGRNNADNLSFTIRKRGPLAIDSGPVHGQNTQVLKFLGEGSDAGVPAIGNYGRQTIAHNSITIGEGEYQHRDWQGKPTYNIVRRGGQSVPPATDWWRKWGFPGPQEFVQHDFRQGRIVAYRTHPLYDYALGDARFSYPLGGMEEITRQFLYLKPDAFVIHDRVVVVDPAQQPCWLLHSLREPKASGAERALTPEEIGLQFLWDGKEKTPHPQPGGHFAMGGDTFLVQSGSPGKPGEDWLAARTLLPADADAERKKVGGKGHDFEVAGVQYGLSDEGYGMADGAYAVNSTIGVLGWRVELRHKQPSKVVEFLHVLQVGADPGVASALGKATLTSSADTHTLRLAQGARSYAITLRRTGARGGSIQVGQVEMALPEAVEDHWRYYRDDPNYRTWVTDPRYQVVIEPTEADRKAAE